MSRRSRDLRHATGRWRLVALGLRPEFTPRPKGGWGLRLVATDGSGSAWQASDFGRDCANATPERRLGPPAGVAEATRNPARDPESAEPPRDFPARERAIEAHRDLLLERLAEQREEWIAGLVRGLRPGSGAGRRASGDPRSGLTPRHRQDRAPVREAMRVHQVGWVRMWQLSGPPPGAQARA